MSTIQQTIHSQRAFAHAVRLSIQVCAAGSYAVAPRISAIREEADGNDNPLHCGRIALRAAERSAWRKDRRNQIKQNGRRWCLQHDALYYGAEELPF